MTQKDENMQRFETLDRVSRSVVACHMIGMRSFCRAKGIVTKGSAFFSVVDTSLRFGFARAVELDNPQLVLAYLSAIRAVSMRLRFERQKQQLLVC